MTQAALSRATWAYEIVDTAWLLLSKILRAMTERQEAGYPVHARITAVSGYSADAISDWP